jgi:hypothetical protein
MLGLAVAILVSIPSESKKSLTQPCSVVDSFTNGCTLTHGAQVCEICRFSEPNESCEDGNKLIIPLKVVCTMLTGVQIYVMIQQTELQTEYSETQQMLAERSRGLRYAQATESPKNCC